MWGAHEGMGWWMMFGAVFWIVVFGALIYAISVFSRGEPRSRDSSESPLDIAKRRYASGEISAEEFERIKRDIG